MSLLTPDVSKIHAPVFPTTKGHISIMTIWLYLWGVEKLLDADLCQTWREWEKNWKIRRQAVYFLCPSQEIDLHKSQLNQVVFLLLCQYIATGFDPKSEAALMLDKDSRMGGALVLGDEHVSNIKSSMKNQPCNIEKFHAYLAYLIELGYYLAFQPSINDSDLSQLIAKK